MENRVFTIKRIFNASRKNVWRAITEKELMKEWYFDLVDFKAEIGFFFEFTGGKEDGVQYLHRCEIIEVIPEQKLKHTWCYVGYKGTSYLTFELFDEGENTLLKLTHAGIDSFPAEVKDFAFHNFENGWNHIIDVSLKQFLENNTY